MSTLAIGFANKYYTLWNITEDITFLGNGCNRVVVHYDYIKNISFDRITAQAKYPTAAVNENLRGKTMSWISAPKEVWSNIDTFRFGKYKFNKIADVEDISYIAWYWDKIYDASHKEFVENFLKEHGYEVRAWETGDKYLVSPEEIERENEELRKKNNLINQANNNAELSFVSSYNPDCDGEINIDGIIYQFEEVAEYDYKGMPYYLPMLNGKAKRIKNKKVIVKDYEMIDLNDNGYIVIMIKDFVVSKI